MKALIAASLLLAFVVPAHASGFRESDRKWLPVVDRWAKAAMMCYKSGYGGIEPRVVKACKILEAAENKLAANGYCFIRESIGRPGKDRKHCDPIDWP